MWIAGAGNVLFPQVRTDRLARRLDSAKCKPQLVQTYLPLDRAAAVPVCRTSYTLRLDTKIRVRTEIKASRDTGAS